MAKKAMEIVKTTPTTSRINPNIARMLEHDRHQEIDHVGTDIAEDPIERAHIERIGNISRNGQIAHGADAHRSPDPAEDGNEKGQDRDVDGPANCLNDPDRDCPR